MNPFLKDARRRPKILRDLVITEVSSVDRGAGEGTKIELYKRDDPKRRQPFNIFKGPIASDTSRFAGKDTIDRSDADVQTGDVTLVIDELVNQLVEAQPAASRQDALHFILHHPRGHALLRLALKKQQSTTKKEIPVMNRAEEIESIVKRDGVVSFAKSIVVSPSLGRHVTEVECTKLLTDHATKIGKRFVDVFTANDEDGIAIRKAHQIVVKASYPIATGDNPAVVGNNTAVVNDDSSALAALTRLAEKSKRPGERFAAAFARVYTDQSNRDLVARERSENRPSA